jgi:prefoldin subunit 5
VIIDTIELQQNVAPPRYVRLEETEAFKKLELKLAEHEAWIDMLQANLERLHKSIDRIEKALDSICG